MKSTTYTVNHLRSLKTLRKHICHGPQYTDSFFSDLNIPEKVGQKTTTYANEWSTPRDDYQTRIPFVPKRKPVLNTNFRGEWTANIGKSNV